MEGKNELGSYLFFFSHAVPLHVQPVHVRYCVVNYRKRLPTGDSTHCINVSCLKVFSLYALSRATFSRENQGVYKGWVKISCYPPSTNTQTTF